jgi:hypothetical protein
MFFALASTELPAEAAHKVAAKSTNELCTALYLLRTFLLHCMRFFYDLYSVVW